MKAILAVLGVLILLAPTAQAATPSAVGGGSTQNCREVGLTKVLAVLSAGTLDMCLQYNAFPQESDQTWLLMGTVDGPDAATGALTYAWAIQTISGCTNSALTTTTDANAAASVSSTYATITMTSPHCSGVVQLTLTAGAITLHPQLAWNSDVPQLHACDETLTACNQADLAQSGTWTVTNAGSQAITLSGTTHQVIDSWPSLTAAVTNSGSLAVTNSGGQTMTLAGTATLAGGITVTNAGGQSIVVTSWPQLSAVLSGTVPTCSTALLAADPMACTVNSNANTTFTGDVNQTLNIPNKMTIGFPGDPDHQGIDWWLEFLFWGVVMFLCFKFRAWLLFGFAAVGSIHLMVPSWTLLAPSDFLPWMLLMLVAEFVLHRRKAQDAEGAPALGA